MRKAHKTVAFEWRSQREMRDSGKSDSTTFLQESSAAPVTSIVLPSLTLYTGSEPEKREHIDDEEIDVRFDVVGRPVSLGSSQGSAKSEPRWSGHSGIRSGGVFYRSTSGEGELAVPVGLQRCEIFLRLSRAQSHVR